MYLCLVKYATVLIKVVDNEKNRRQKDIFSVFTWFQKYFENYVVMTHHIVLLRHNLSWISQSDLHAITSRMRGLLPIVGIKNSDVRLGVQIGKYQEFNFASNLIYTHIFMPHEHF